MTTGEKAVVFDCEGESLIGIISAPAARARVGVLVIVGGPQYRVGSHRQFVLFGRHLAAMGIPSMRFDCRGMGDSTGELRGFEESKADIAAAIDAFVRECPGIEQVVLWGLCDAASASLLYWNATGDARVAGIVMLNPWVLTEDELEKTRVRHHFRYRLLQRDFWSKLVSGKIDIKGAFSSLRRAMRPEPTTQYQDAMADALERFTCPVLIVLSGDDLTAKGFLDYCRSRPRWSQLVSAGNVEQVEVPEADHTFAAGAWRDRVHSITGEWLTRHFAGAKAAVE